jgi:hypothetical protein
MIFSGSCLIRSYIYPVQHQSIKASRNSSRMPSSSHIRSFSRPGQPPRRRSFLTLWYSLRGLVTRAHLVTLTLGAGHFPGRVVAVAKTIPRYLATRLRLVPCIAPLRCLFSCSFTSVRCTAFSCRSVTLFFCLVSPCLALCIALCIGLSRCCSAVFFCIAPLPPSLDFPKGVHCP